MSEPLGPSRQAIVDEEHLKLLALGYWISGGLDAFASLIGVFYGLMGAVFGTVISKIPAKPAQEPPPAALGLIFVAFGLAIFAGFIVFALLKFKAARSIKRRQSRVFCMVAGAISCVGIPWGTLLGVFTFLVLGRPSVVALFAETTAARGTSAP